MRIIPTLALPTDLGFMVVFEIFDGVGQGLLEIGVFQSALAPQASARRNQVTVRASVSGIVARDIGMINADHMHQSNDEG